MPSGAQEQTGQQNERTRRARAREDRKNKTLGDIEASKKRKATDPPDSCGKPGDPHDLDNGQMVKSKGPISADCRARLDNRFVGGGGLTIAEVKQASS